MNAIAGQTDLFWSRLSGIGSGMLGLTSDFRLVPMSHLPDPRVGCLWYITAGDTDLLRALAFGSQEAVYVLSDTAEGLFARIEGRLSLSSDPERLDDLWHQAFEDRFRDNKPDPDTPLMRLDMIEAELWVTEGHPSFLDQIADAQRSGNKPHLGDHFTLHF